MNVDNISRLDSIFYNGNGALAKLTKIRCSIRNIKALKEVKRCIKLYSWPLPFENNEYIIRHLNGLGIIAAKKLSVDAFEIPYSSYKELTNPVKFNISELRVLRSCINVKRLINVPKDDIQLSLVWDREKYEDSTSPLTTNDHSKINTFQTRKDAQYIFNHPNQKWYSKIPVYLGPLVFNELKLFENKEFHFKDIREIKNTNSDAEGRSNRYIIKESNRKSLRRIIKLTSKNILKVLNNEEWIDQVRDSTINFYD